MKPFQIALLLLITTSACDAQNTSSVVIRLLNGKNGKPVVDKQVNIVLGAKAFSMDADSKGEIVLDIRNVEPPELQFGPDYYVDCRYKRDQVGPVDLNLKYSLDEITSKGVVGRNFCGKASAPPTPGVLTLYVRPRTFLEGMSL